MGSPPLISGETMLTAPSHLSLLHASSCPPPLDLRSPSHIPRRGSSTSLPTHPNHLLSACTLSGAARMVPQGARPLQRVRVEHRSPAPRLSCAHTPAKHPPAPKL